MRLGAQVVVAAVTLVVLLTLVAVLQPSRVRADEVQRLQEHGQATLHGPDGHTVVHALCDTGNGVMLYVTRVASGADWSRVQVVAVPGGCDRARGER